MKKPVISLGLICLVIILLVTCFAKLAAATPSPKPAHAPMQAVILTTPVFAGPYAHAVALTEFLKKQAPWLRISVAEGYFAAKAIIEGAKRDPKNLIMSMALTPFNSAKMGVPPFKQKYPDLRLISYGEGLGSLWATLDPTLKKIKDCAGKKIAHGPTFVGETALHIDSWEYYGLKGKVTFIEGNFKEGADNLRDGLVDVCLYTMVRVKNGWVHKQDFIELFESKKDKLHWMSLPHEVLDWSLPRHPGIVALKGKVPAGTLPNQAEPLEAFLADMSGLACFVGANEELIYEVTKANVENIDKLPGYAAHLAGIYREAVLGQLIEAFPDTWRDLLHPGALRYYKEAGMLPK